MSEPEAERAVPRASPADGGGSASGAAPLAEAEASVEPLFTAPAVRVALLRAGLCALPAALVAPGVAALLGGAAPLQAVLLGALVGAAPAPLLFLERVARRRGVRPLPAALLALAAAALLVTLAYLQATYAAQSWRAGPDAGVERALEAPRRELGFLLVAVWLAAPPLAGATWARLGGVRRGLLFAEAATLAPVVALAGLLGPWAAGMGSRPVDLALLGLALLVGGGATAGLGCLALEGLYRLADALESRSGGPRAREDGSGRSAAQTSEAPPAVASSERRTRWR